MSKSLTAIFASLLKVDANNPGFEVRLATDNTINKNDVLDNKHSSEQSTLDHKNKSEKEKAEVDSKERELIFTVAKENADKLLKELSTVFQSHGHTVERFPFRLVKLKSVEAAKATAISKNAASNMTITGGPTGGSAGAPAIAQNENIDLPKADFPLLDIDSVDGSEIFERLFSAEFRATFGKIDWKKTKALNGQDVYYYDCPTEIENTFSEAQIKIFKNVLSHASWNDLYYALAKDRAKPLNVSDAIKNTSGNGPLKPHLDVLFRGKMEEGKFVIRFDYRGLMQCMLSPKFKIVPEASVAPSATVVQADDATATATVQSTLQSNKVEIRVDYAHFLAYMSTLLHEGVFLYEKGNRIIPIGLNRSHALSPVSSTLIDFSIDCSGSMFNATVTNAKGVVVSVFAQLIVLLKAIVDKLPNHLDINNTVVRFSPFGGQLDVLKSVEFPLSEINKLHLELDSMAVKTRQEMHTALFQFLTNKYRSYLQDAKKSNHNIVHILITDGGDNNSPQVYHLNSDGSWFKAVLNDLDQGGQSLQFYSLEIGSNIEKDVLESINKITQGERINVGTHFENMQPFYDDLKKLRNFQYLIKFVQGDLKNFKLKVVEGEVTNPRDETASLDPAIPFTMNDTVYMAQKTDPTPKPSLLAPDIKVGEEAVTMRELQAKNKALSDKLDALQKIQDTRKAEAKAAEEKRFADLEAKLYAEAEKHLAEMEIRLKAEAEKRLAEAKAAEETREAVRKSIEEASEAARRAAEDTRAEEAVAAAEKRLCDYIKKEFGVQLKILEDGKISSEKNRPSISTGTNAAPSFSAVSGGASVIVSAAVAASASGTTSNASNSRTASMSASQNPAITTSFASQNAPTKLETGAKTKLPAAQTANKSSPCNVM